MELIRKWSDEHQHTILQQMVFLSYVYFNRLRVLNDRREWGAH